MIRHETSRRRVQGTRVRQSRSTSPILRLRSRHRRRARTRSASRSSSPSNVGEYERAAEPDRGGEANAEAGERDDPRRRARASARGVGFREDLRRAGVRADAPLWTGKVSDGEEYPRWPPPQDEDGGDEEDDEEEGTTCARAARCALRALFDPRRWRRGRAALAAHPVEVTRSATRRSFVSSASLLAHTRWSRTWCKASRASKGKTTVQ